MRGLGVPRSGMALHSTASAGKTALPREARCARLSDVDTLATLARDFGRYLAHRLPDATRVRVEEIRRIHGGASRETYRVRISYDEAGEARRRGLILRRGHGREQEEDCQGRGSWGRRWAEPHGPIIGASNLT